MANIVSNTEGKGKLVPLCIYEIQNLDAFIAAWAVWDYYDGEVQTMAVSPGRLPLEVDVLGRDIILLGPLYQPMALEMLADRASTVLWLTVSERYTQPCLVDNSNIRTVKQNHSIALTAWQYYHGKPPKPFPSLLEIMFSHDFARFHQVITNNAKVSNGSQPTG